MKYIGNTFGTKKPVLIYTCSTYKSMFYNIFLARFPFAFFCNSLIINKKAHPLQARSQVIPLGVINNNINV